MANMQFANNAATTLASSILVGATSLTVASGTGTLFPTLSGSQYFYCTLSNAAGTTIEIVKVTARSTDTFTITRAQDGTTASAFSTGDKVELRLVRASLNDFPKLDETNSYSGQNYFAATTLTDGATISWDVSVNQVATVTLGGNRTMAAPTNLVSGSFYSLNVIQDATGSRTLTWNSVFKWTGAAAPTLSTAASAKDFFVFRSDGTNLYEQGRSLGVA
jgi:hypothetical protein